MKLKEIIVHNVGIYYGRHVIQLDANKRTKPIVLIGALNGCGKTTVLEALRLGLYGKLAKSSRRGTDAYDSYLKKLINKSASPAEGAAIEIAFQAPGPTTPEEIRIVRTWTVGQSGRVTEKVEVYRDGEIAADLAGTWDDEVERFFPQKLCSLFFFDGEEIEALADPSRAKEIFNTALNSLLGLELVDRANSDLAIIGRKLRQGIVADDVRNSLENLDASIDDQMKALVSLASDRSRVGHQIAEAQERVKRADENFRVSGGDIFSEIKKLEGQLETLRTKRKAALAELRKLAEGTLPLAMIFPQLHELRTSIGRDVAVQNARVLAGDLKVRDSNLLGWAMAQGWNDKLLVSLSEYVQSQRYELEQTAAQSISMDVDSKSLEDLHRIIEVEMPKDKARLASVLSELKRIEKNIDTLEHKISKAPSESAIMELALERTKSHVLLDGLQGQMTNISDKQKAIELEKVTSEKKRDELLRSAEMTGLEAELHSRMAARTDQLAECMRTFKSAVLLKHIARLEDAIFDSYRKLLRKEGLVSKVTIDPVKMELTLFDASNRLIPLERLSAGERQLLATSILWGLAKSSGRALPVVIDTPLGRLDATHREKLIKHYFPDASHQVILLSTDEEINEKYYSQIKRHVGLEYQLAYDESTGGTSVKTGYLFAEVA